MGAAIFAHMIRTWRKIVNMADSERGSKGCRTLFVRNLPLKTTNDQLEKLFGDIGPVKRCFVIKDKGTSSIKSINFTISQPYREPSVVGRQNRQVRFRGVHLATVFRRPQSVHRPGRAQPHHAHMLQIGLRLAITQADVRPVMPISFR